MSQTVASTSVGRGCERIVKLGGAAITDKRRLETVNDVTLDACVAHLAQVVIEDRSSGDHSSTVVVHGAGSFGHFQAAQAGVASGWAAARQEQQQQVKKGFADTRVSVTHLNHEVCRRLAAAGVVSAALSPFGSWTTDSREVTQHGTPAVAAALAAGLVPVLHGDAVLDESLGCTILSGDTIVRCLAQQLKPQVVVFLTNVDGVFDRPPEEPGAQLVTHVDVAPDGSWRAYTSAGGGNVALNMSAAEHDTTGGMAAKVAEAAAIVQGGTDVLIAKAGTSHALAALRGQPLGQQQRQGWVGTHLRPVGACASD